MIWSEILAEIKRCLKEPTTGGHWTDAEYLRRANAIQDDICMKTFCLEKTADLVYDGGIRYAKPAKCFKIKEVLFNGKTKRLTGITSDELDLRAKFGEQDWRSTIGEPNYYFQDGVNIGLYPLSANSATTDIVTMKYYSTPTAMKTTSSVPFDGLDSLTGAIQALIDGVVYRCMLEDQNELYQVYKQEYNTAVILLKNQMGSNPDALGSIVILRPRG